jgi:predicted phage tail protein
MEKQNNNSGFLKILVILLGIGILGLGYYTYDMYNEAKDTQQILQQEKEQVINELEDLKVNYDQAIQEKTEVSEKLEEAKSRIEALIQEVKKQKKINAGIIHKYKREIAALKAQRDKLYKIADSLRAANMNLITENDSLSTDLTRQKQFNDTLLNKNQELSQTLNKAKILYPTNLKAEGVKIKSSGKVVTTSKYKRATDIRVCFTVPKNDILENGPQKFYVQIVNPKGDVIGSGEMITVGDQQIVISGAEEVIYENKALKVCIFVKPKDKKSEFVKGKYDVVLYHNGHKVGTTEFELEGGIF